MFGKLSVFGVPKRWEDMGNLQGGHSGEQQTRPDLLSFNSLIHAAADWKAEGLDRWWIWESKIQQQ